VGSIDASFPPCGKHSKSPWTMQRGYRFAKQGKPLPTHICLCCRTNSFPMGLRVNSKGTRGKRVGAAINSADPWAIGIKTKKTRRRCLVALVAGFPACPREKGNQTVALDKLVLADTHFARWCITVRCIVIRRCLHLLHQIGDWKDGGDNQTR